MTTNPAPGPAAPAKKDFFVSYNKADRQMAEWIAWQLKEAGCSVTIDIWDFVPGTSFPLEMRRAVKECRRIVTVLSAAYIAAEYTQPEWAAFFVRDPGGKERSIVPVRVGEFPAEELLSQLIYIDLLGLGEEAARKALLDGVAGARTGSAVPDRPPLFHPRAAAAPPSFPAPAAGGSGLHLHQLPPHPPVFLGREEEVEQLSAHLAREGAQVT